MSKKANLFFWVCILSTLAAIGTHAYLTQHHYSFKYGQIATESACNVNETVNCNATTASSYSEFFGIPVSIPGFLIHLVLLFLLLAFRYPFFKNETRKDLGGTIRLICLGIFITSLAMGFISYAILHTICPFCTGAYILSLVSLISAWILTEGSPLYSSSQMKIYGGIAAFLLVSSFFGHKDFMRQYGGNKMIEMMQLQVSEWNRVDSKNIATTSPLVMNASASSKMKIIEFADYLCGHCAHAYPILHTFVKSHPDVEFSFQAFPLDGACNSAIEYSEGTRCLLAQISQCAGDQGNPWKTQSWIFENQPNLLSKDIVLQKLKEKIPELGLNEETLMTCTEAEETREIIRKQAQNGVDAGVQGTPSIYVNGKKVPGRLSVEILNRIYSEIHKN